LSSLLIITILALYYKTQSTIIMRAVFLDQQTFNSDISLSTIKNQVTELICYSTTPANKIIERCINAEIIITNKVVLSKAITLQLPQLKLICIAATGSNNVDIIAARQQNIAVTNVSGYAQQSVAQYVFAQILAYYSQTNHHNNNTKQGLWQQSETFCYHGNAITELADKTLGIIGYGNLGKAVANIANAFKMKVLIAERPNAADIRNGRLSFKEVIQQADIISLHCPQTIETENLIDTEVFNVMKTNAMLINTARGAIINNEALISALANKKIAYAVLDVLDSEPPPADHPLLNCHLANLKITAHIAWASLEAQQRLLDGIAKNISAYSTNTSLNRLD
jgi:glycerate dehydrogenase